MSSPIAMAPAYGGMFRPPPPRRKWLIVVVVFVMLVVAGVFGYRAYRRSQQMPIGVPCTLTAGVDSESETYLGCNGGLCIREVDGDSYCSQECVDDNDCPSRYVCELTHSRKRRACMHEGADVSPPYVGPEDAAPPHVFRRQRP
jgi:hypothetical protein